MALACDQHLLVEGHFGAGLSPDLEKILRAHLPTCAACRSLYERHLLLARLEPNALAPRDRLGRGLGFDAPPRPGTPWLSPAWRSGLTFAAVAAVVLLGPLRPHQIDEFVARSGGGPQDVDVKIVALGIPTDAGALEAIPADAELAFAYANRSNRRYLMILSIDAYMRVAWFYPAWTDPNTNPQAIPIEHSETLKELPDAVRQHYSGQMVHVMGLFLEKPLSVREVEANITASTDARPHIPGALVWETDLRTRSP